MTIAPATESPTATSTTAQWFTLSTPDGPFSVVADDTDVVLASGWIDDPAYLAQLIHPTLRPESLQQTDRLDDVRGAVESYYDGELTAIDKIEVRQRSGPFLQSAWSVLRTVTPGEPVSYTEFAELAGKPAAIRAAAAACARNAAALFVPCHRVLRTDGSLGGFRYGLPIKRSLLDREEHRPS
ncbi:methylated-DNA--[protein]-cysteine S-methyltransferase [Gordonia sp. CPCC 206044]|uniref:methylated-DNA--[protein]-cysteine S-methyltransferase n=1 Tax=Gordonia sp. CPCC 206044 TaxID=3140793 RepID=UPI003AF3F762